MKLQKRKKQYGTVGKYCGRDLYIKRTVRGRLQRRIGLRRGKNRYLCLAIICVCLLATGGLLFKMRILLGDREISTTASAADCRTVTVFRSISGFMRLPWQGWHISGLSGWERWVMT